MFRRAFAIIALLAAVGSISKQASADVPYLIPVMGKLTDANGTPLQGNQSLVISLYDAETAGTELWNEIFAQVLFTNGLFNVYLGAGSTPLEIEDFLTTDEIWLEITVSGDTPMTRVRLASIPWAMECEQIGNISADQASQTCASGQYLQGWDENGPICIEDRLPSVTESGGTVTVQGDLTVTGSLIAEEGFKVDMFLVKEQTFTAGEMEIACGLEYRAIGCSTYVGSNPNEPDFGYCYIRSDSYRDRCYFKRLQKSTWDSDHNGYCYCIRTKY